jgi:formamidopyrimidine-DNA glycosylase
VPELPEVEAYRRLAESIIGLPIVGVDAPDAWYLKGGIDAAGVEAALVGRKFDTARRRGKMLLLDTRGGPTLGLRFGMTGRLVVDGVPGVDRLIYSSDRDRPEWNRFRVSFPGERSLVVRDPRRLGGVYVDPDEARLGPDALSLTLPELRHALAGSAAPLKARLMDQARIAGVGNLIADEALWRAGLDPARPAGSLTDAETRRLARVLRRTLDDLIGNGGSHTGDLMVSRVPGGLCPKDGAPLIRRTVGGRTTWSCPRHQI